MVYYEIIYSYLQIAFHLYLPFQSTSRFFGDFFSEASNKFAMYSGLGLSLSAQVEIRYRVECSDNVMDLIMVAGVGLIPVNVAINICVLTLVSV